MERVLDVGFLLFDSRRRKLNRYVAPVGLALVRSIVQLSGGRLGIKSQRDIGSTFWVELPFAVGPPKVEASRIPSNKGTTAGHPSPQVTPSSFPPIQTQPTQIMTSDGQPIPMRPVPQMNISYGGTDSPYSERTPSFRKSPHEEIVETALEGKVTNKSDDTPIAVSIPTAVETQLAYPLDEQNNGSVIPVTVKMTEVSRNEGDQVIETAISPTDQAVVEAPSLPLVVMVVDDDPLTRLLMTRVCLCGISSHLLD